MLPLVSPNKFRLMGLESKSKFLKDYGECISSRSYKNRTIYLFVVMGFFVEVWQDSESKKITKIGLVSREFVELLYLEKIELNV